MIYIPAYGVFATDDYLPLPYNRVALYVASEGLSA